MRVGAWEAERGERVVRLSLRLTWEDRDRADDTVWMDWPAALAGAVTAEPDAALLVAYPLAMWFGERRVEITGAVCPRLADGTRTAMALVAHGQPSLRPVVLNLTERSGASVPLAPERDAAVCLSGGVDALSALRENLLTTPAADPARYRQGLFVFGLNSYDFENGVPRPERVATYEAQAARLTTLADDVGLTLVRVATNLRSLYPSFDAWGAVPHDSPLAAVGHAMRTRLRSLAIGSSGAAAAEGVLRHEVMHAFHSSRDLDVHVVQVMARRLEKLRRIAQWPAGLATLRVCLLIDLPASGQVNCGRCEKCVRTMLQLLVIGGGALSRAPFPEQDVSPEAIDRIRIDSMTARLFYVDLAPALAALGRDDLASAIRRGLARSPRRAASASGWRRWWRRNRE